ncbi:hypothetical protein [Methylobacter sp. BlB1]|uniref:hypothetical protein n=1 Tax=unclassified Methylobacter TaxID=2635283 RepID=UPI00189639DF|nr:hypothetical protein [Methylobacter sp. BlB1]MBF6651194.1 hypothetical protein [Methylobacter sp. BlB1]
MVLEKIDKIAKMRDERGLLLLKLFSAWACFGGLGMGWCRFCIIAVWYVVFINFYK